MKKNVLALSIAAMIGGFAGAASAEVLIGSGLVDATHAVPAPAAAMTPNNFNAATGVNFAQSEGGSGHILLVPYFTTQNNNMTVLHVVNTDLDNGKALKVRFRGAANSDDILDFTVFLSPGDVWTGAVLANAEGSYFQTDDNSCTYPSIGKEKIQFVTARLNQGWTPDRIANNTKEGYVEVFNVADIPKWTVYGNPAGQSELYRTIKHVNGVAPCDATVLEKTRTLTGEPALANYGFDTPTGGLSGDWYIMNVNQTTTFSGAATTVRAVDAAGANARANYVLFPQDDGLIADADPLTADPLYMSSPANAKGVIVEGPLLQAVNYDFPDLSTPYVNGLPDTDGVKAAQQAYLLTNAVARSQAVNQYATDALISAKTDWVFSMPTRRYSVGANYAVASGHADYRVFNLGVNSLGTVGTAPGAGQNLLAAGTTAVKGADANFFNGSNTSVDALGNICVGTSAAAFYDREERFQTSGPMFSPGNTAKVALCGEVSVLSFKDAGNSVLGASVARANVDKGVFENGWGSIATNAASTGGNTIGAIPLMGASFIKLTNPAVSAGMSGTYGITWPHRYNN